MFLQGTPHKLAQKNIVHDYFDSESESSCKKTQSTPIVEQNTQIYKSLTSDQLNIYENSNKQFSQLEVEKRRGAHIIQTELILNQYHQRNGLEQSGYFYSDQKQFSPNEQMWEEEDRDQQKFLSKNVNIFQKNVLADKNSEIININDNKIIKNKDINKESSLSSAINSNDNPHIKVIHTYDNYNHNQNTSRNFTNISNQIQYTNPKITFQSDNKTLTNKNLSYNTNINNIFAQTNNNIQSENIHNNFQQTKQNDIDLLSNDLSNKAESLQSKEQYLIYNDNIQVDATYNQLKDINQTDFENDLLEQELEIEINGSFDEDEDDDSDQEMKIYYENNKSKYENLIRQNGDKTDNFKSNQQTQQITQNQQEIDQQSNQSRIGGLSLNKSELSCQLKAFFAQLQEYSTGSEGSKDNVVRQVDGIANENSLSKLEESQKQLNDYGFPDPFINQNYFQKKQNGQLSSNDNPETTFLQIGKPKTPTDDLLIPNQHKIKQNNNIKQLDNDQQNKTSSLFKELNQINGFNISNKVKQNTQFNKFTNGFEGFNDEEGDIDKFDKNQKENIKLKEQINNSNRLQFIKHKPQEAKPLQQNQSLKQDNMQKQKDNQDIISKSDILNDLKQMNGFKVSAKVQKDQKFSSFLNFFESMDNEDEQKDETLNCIKQNSDEQKSKFKLEQQNNNYDFKGFSNIQNEKGNIEQQQIGIQFSKPSKNGFQIMQIQNELNKPIKGLNNVLSKYESLFEDLSQNSQKDNSIQQQEQEKNYDNFFNKSANNDNEFFGFKTADNKKKLQVDEQKMQMLQKVFDQQDSDKKQQNLLKSEEEYQNQNKYDDFFKKSSEKNEPFLRFQLTKGNKKLDINPEKLEKLEKVFFGGDEDENESCKMKQEIPKITSNRGQKRKEVQFSDESDDEKQNSIGFSGGFSTVFGNKKLKIDQNKIKQFQAMMDKDDEDDVQQDFNINTNSNSKLYTNQRQNLSNNSLGSSKQPAKQVNQFKKTNNNSKQTSNDFKVQNTNNKQNAFDINNKNKNGQDTLPGFASSRIQKQQQIKDNGINEEEEEDDDFARMLKLVKKPAQPKRDHPKPFKSVKVVDSSKSTPIFSKTTPTNNKSTPSIKSTKVNGRQNKSKIQMFDEQGSSFLFAKDSTDKSGQKSAKSSLSRPFSKPQSLEKINDIEFDKKSKDGKSKSNGFSFIREEDEECKKHKKQQEQSSKKSSKNKDCMSAVKDYPPIMYQYFDNPMIQMKYSYDSQLSILKAVKYEELQIKQTYHFNNNQMEIEYEGSQFQNKIQKDCEIYSKDINKCIFYQMICNCQKQTNDSFLIDYQENSFSKQIPCFCYIRIPKIEKNEEEQQKDKQQQDFVLQNSQNNIQKGYLNYLNFFAKLQAKEKNVEEKWVRTHFRQIVWKLANYENNICNCPVNKKLTIENIYYELEYRLYSEMYVCKRSILKQIEEQDAVKSLNMVLMVTNIVYNQQSGAYVLEFSDGWYSFFVVVFNQKVVNSDMYYASNKSLILDLITKNKIYIGIKVYINQIQLPPILNFEKFISPNQNIYYQKVYEIFYNNIIPASPDAKLGVTSNALQKYFPRSLKSLRPYGGNEIQSIDVFIIKKYPLCYESGLIKRSFCNPKQMEDDGMEGKTLGFSILVIDALSYYDPQFQIDQQPWVEVNIHSISRDLYDSLREGTRIRLYNLKIHNKGQNKFKFDYKQQRVIKNILYFDTTKKTKIEEMSTFIKSKDDQLKMRNFGLDLIEKNKYLLEDVQESIQNNLYNKNILESQLVNNKVEMDVIMYIVKIENGSFFGINQNYSAICISPIKDIQQSTSNIFKKQPQDDEYSKEDAYLYEKLNKHREIKIQDKHFQSNTGNSSLFQNAEEGKIGVFLNVQLQEIKNTNLSTSNLEKYHFNFTFNTHKKTYNYEQLSLTALPFSEKYKQWISELNQCIRIGSNKFLEVQNYLRNC